jgi:hypothetical protein
VFLFFLKFGFRRRDVNFVDPARFSNFLFFKFFILCLVCLVMSAASETMDSFCWQDVAKFAVIHSKRETINKFPDFFKNQKNPHRKLNAVIERYVTNCPDILLDSSSREPPYGLDIDILLKQKVVAFMQQNNNRIDDVRIRQFLEELLQLNNKTHLLKENAGGYRFGHQWAGRSLARWKISDRIVPSGEEVVVDSRVQMSHAEWRDMITDTSRIIRRRANDPLPCVDRRHVARKKVRYEDEDEEDCWINTLHGGYEEYERLTLDDRLMLPCSVRSETFICSKLFL